MHAVLVSLLLVFGLAVPTYARQPAPQAPDIPRASQTRSSHASPQEPVPVPEPTALALQYHRSGNVLWVVDTLWGFLVPALMLFTGFSSRLRDIAQRVGRRWFFTVIIYLTLFSLVVFVVSLPLSYYEEFVRQHAYGLSNQTLQKWWGDSLKSLAVGIIAGAALLWIPFGLLRRSPTRWWLYTAMAAIPVMFVVLMIVPVWVDPLFNDFGPMTDKSLESRILDLAARAGIDGGRVYEVNKSIDTKTMNAYVTGFFDTKRIVLWDTTLKNLDDQEVLFIMGHEMGHYVLGHVLRTVVLLSVVILATLYLAHRLSRGLIDRFAPRFGFDRLSDVAALPLLLLLTNVFGFAIAPGLLAFTRSQEHEADRFGLEITQNNHAAASAFVSLQQENLGVPRPGLIVRLWRATHPVLGDRIDFANAYHPWTSGEPLKYGTLFRAPSDGR